MFVIVGINVLNDCLNKYQFEKKKEIQSKTKYTAKTRKDVTNGYLSFPHLLTKQS